MAEYAYCRVSTRDQNLDRQLVAMEEQGIPSKNIFSDKASGKDFDRPEWQRLLRKMKPGDTLIIKSLDRLGRNYDEILEQWADITKKDIGIIVLDMPILNTAKDRDLTGRLIANIVLQLLSYVAETERAFIKQRQKEGIAAAKARGVQLGRKPKPRHPTWRIMCRRIEAGELSVTLAAKALGIPRSTMHFYLKQYREELAASETEQTAEVSHGLN